MKKLLFFTALLLATISAGAQSTKKGDANQDKKVNTKDIVEVTNAIMGNPSADYSKENADANSDKAINVADIIVIVSMIEDGGGSPRLVVWKTDGTKVYYELDDMPETTFEDGNLIIRTQNGLVEVSYPLTEILRYTYDGINKKGVSEARSTGKALVKRTPNTVTLANLKEGANIQLFNSDGTLLKTITSNGTDNVTVSVAPYPNGVYLVKYESQTIKLIKQ